MYAQPLNQKEREAAFTGAFWRAQQYQDEGSTCISSTKAYRYGSYIIDDNIHGGHNKQYDKGGKQNTISQG